MSYGCDSTVAYSRSTVDVRHIATDLLGRLRHLQEEEVWRCNCLFGVRFAQSLIHLIDRFIGAIERGHLPAAEQILQVPGVDINEPSKDRRKRGRNALHLACLEGSIDVVQFLLKQPGIKVNEFDQGDKTPLSLALSKRNEEIALLLLER